MHTHTQSVLIIGRFCICKFTYWLNFIYKANVYFIHRHAQARGGVKCVSPNVHILSWSKQLEMILCILVSALIPLTSVLFISLFSATLVPFFTFLCFLVILVILLFKMDPKQSAEVLSRVPKSESCDVSYREDTCVRWASFRRTL